MIIMRFIFTVQIYVLYYHAVTPSCLCWVSEIFSNILKPLPTGLEGLYSIYIPLMFKEQ